MAEELHTDQVTKIQSEQQGQDGTSQEEKVDENPKKKKKKRRKKSKKRKRKNYMTYYNAPPGTFEALKPYIPQEGNSPKGGRPPISPRKVINALHYMAKVGCPWRALPEKVYGPWITMYCIFRRWLSKGFFKDIFDILSKKADLSKAMIDGSIIKAHKHSAGASHKSPGPEHQDIGLSRGGLSTKIHSLVDAQGRPVNFILTPGNVNDIVMAPELLKELKNGTVVLADKGYDSDALINQLKSQGCDVVIPPRSNRKQQRKVNKKEYKKRHHVENFFDKVKEFRRISTRYDKLSYTYYGFLLFASSFVWLASYKLDIKKEGYLAL